jgi:hypothetical protein
MPLFLPMSLDHPTEDTGVDRCVGPSAAGPMSHRIQSGSRVVANYPATEHHDANQ